MQTLTPKDLKILFLSSLGGALEYYDFILFVIFAQYISFHFFPDSLSDFWKSFFVYSAFASGYMARPLGGIVMAHFGDKFGRKNIFVLSILLIVVPTFSLTFLPTYATLGIFAPLFLVLVRLAQGIAVGGEVPCSWVFVSEHTTRVHRGAFLGVLSAGITAGILLGSVVSLLLHEIFSHEEMLSWAWRVPFFLGGIFGLLAIYLRRFLSETPTFRQMQEEGSIKRFPLFEAFKSHKKAILLSMLSTCFLAGGVMGVILFAPRFVGQVLGWSAVRNDLLQIGGLWLYFLGCVVAGAAGDRFGIARACKVFALGFGFSTLGFCIALYVFASPQITIALYLLTCLSAGIINFCPMIMMELFEPQVRLSGASFSYNIGQAIIGGITPPVIFLLHTFSRTHTGALAPLGLYAYFVIIALLAWACAVWFGRWEARKRA